MSEYRLRTHINGVPYDTVRACPECDSSNIEYGIYRNMVNPSGLTQPNKPVNDNYRIEVSGIVRPATNDDPHGYFRPAPSGLARTYKHPYANEGSMGRDIWTYYDEVNYYEPYWFCNSCHAFFVRPVPQVSSLPSGLSGNFEHEINIDPFSQFL